ncbi:MAG: PKD domain-containing protein [Flavobacteriales bacterium]|nr:PKD domain-containing protein [Flavobacteriales bacterium]
MKRQALLVVSLCWSVLALATHILGGEMYYDKLAGDEYRITLKLYRDCGPGNVNGTGFDAEAQLAVYNGLGLLQSTHFVPLPVGGEQPVPVDLNNPCLAVPGTICATWALYTTVLELPPNPTGYVISYQRCCRTPSMTNLPTGLLQGLTCTVQIPPSGVTLVNSSPRFQEYPPVVLCIGQDMVFDHSATDPDGDQLVYDLYTPFAGGTPDFPQPMAGPPPYAPIVWGNGYSGAVPMDGAPGVAVDPSTGAFTVHPTVIGSFTVGVRVREFRNGVQLSESIRDVRMDVVACEANIVSSIQDQQEFCSGMTVFLENESVNGQTYHWDFGDASLLGDTSALAEPQWTYADTGTYAIQLIANPGWPCADTSWSSFEVHMPLNPHFERPAIRCTDEAALLHATGSFTAAASIVWDFGDQSVPVTATGVDVAAAYITTGVHAVRLTVQDFGCEESYTDSVVVYPRPTLSATSDEAGCVNVPFDFSAVAEAWTALRYSWDLGDGTGSAQPTLIHAYAQPGTYDVRVTVNTDEGCIDEKTLLLVDQVEVYPEPVAEFNVTPEEVSLLDPVVRIKDYAQQAVAWEYLIDGALVQEPSFTYEFDDAGTFVITQRVTSGTNCTNEVSHTVNVIDHLFYAPTAFTPDGDGINDVFLPSVRGARLYELVIMDRWGTERFRTTSTKEGWSGDGLPQGVYNYQVHIAEYGAFRKAYQGHVTLLR